MPTKLLWIHKDLTSDVLSRSSKAEESQIRNHVQCHRPKPTHNETGDEVCHCLACTKTSTAARFSRGQLPVTDQSRTQIVRRSRESLKRRDSTPIVAIPAFMDPLYPHLNAAERRSLSFFVCRTAPEWSGWQDSEFWNSLALQACQQSRGILHGLIAMAAWHESDAESWDHDRVTRLSNLRVSQWVKALSQMRDAKNLTYCISLISCVILACLQSNCGNFQSYRLLRSGNTILNELDRQILQSDRTVSDADIHMIDQYVRPLIGRLEARLCVMGDKPAALALSSRWRAVQGFPKRALPRIPSGFTTLHEARNCLEGILNWGHDNVIDAQINPDSLDTFHVVLKDRIDQWHKALDSMPASSKFPQHCPRLLEIAALNGVILLSTCMADSETVFDTHLDEFTRIMQLLEDLPSSRTRQGRVSFGVDCGLIDIVAFVGTRCRDPRLRRSAITWLQNTFRYEGERLGSVAAYIVGTWMDLEEHGLDVRSCHDIPESNRRRLVHGEQYHSARCIRLSFVSSPYDINDASTIDVRSLQMFISDGMIVVTPLPADARVDGPPDVKIGSSYTAFLDDEGTGSYHVIDATKFFFAIPRI